MCQFYTWPNSGSTTPGKKTLWFPGDKLASGRDTKCLRSLLPVLKTWEAEEPPTRLVPDDYVLNRTHLNTFNWMCIQLIHNTPVSSLDLLLPWPQGNKSACYHRHTLFYCAPLCASFTDVTCFTNWRQVLPPATRLQLALLQDLLYCDGLDPNP